MDYQGLTPYHAKYLAYELTLIHAADDPQKFTASLSDAQVDLTPHQIDAALFAFQSPLSTGAILADEVGLGKTIEAGIVLSQKWAERKRKLLVICPANLRKQWSQELADKFFLPSVILEAKSFKKSQKTGNNNPFKQDKIIICSFAFARSKELFLLKMSWNLVIIDEAHRLRNVYKPSNKTGRAIKNALRNTPKILLTATPLQNSLLELYGLVSLVDEYVFGDLKSFKAQFARLSNDANFEELKQRLKPVCQRTLRRQVLEYVPYTNRHALVERYIPYSREQQLYELVSDYLQRDDLFALPPRQRQLMTLILRKLLASSSFAIARTLEKLEEKLRLILKEYSPIDLEELVDDFETLEETQEEWQDGETIEAFEIPEFSDSELLLMKQEADDLKHFKELANSITRNSKGDKLLIALGKGFEKIKKLGGPNKAIIFTESIRTQAYLYQLLGKNGYQDQLVLFNGSNNDEKSREIYKNWIAKHEGTDRISGAKAADIRAAIVEYFRDTATILIATEAAAEGINLQFCSLVVNYDLPWNPQRIEQRIGRCHRYGQRYDVVVINFLNENNAADQRVYQLLDQKFQLFQGVFGASDEVLGNMESGIDFEKRIAAIYQNCRTKEEIKEAFDALQLEFESDISETMRKTRRKLLENFDIDVAQKLRIRYKDAMNFKNAYEEKLWNLTSWYLRDYATFDTQKGAFTLNKNPFPETPIHSGPYRMGRNVQDANLFRVHHPLAKLILKDCKNKKLPTQQLHFNYSDTKETKITILEGLIGQSGWLKVERLLIASAEEEEYLLLSGITDSGESLDEEKCSKLFSLPATVDTEIIRLSDQTQEWLSKQIDQLQQNKIAAVITRNNEFLDREMDKYDKWAEDKKRSLEKEISDLDSEIKLRKSEARKLMDLQQKINDQRIIKRLEKLRNKKRQTLYVEQDKVEHKKEELLDEVQKRLQQNVERTTLFTIQWTLR